jgi:dihydroorotate dehydrogenase electron transfer subunit
MDGDRLPKAYRVARVIPENETAKTWILDGRLEAAPGQFVMAWLPRVDEKPFSLADADPITLTVARVGPFTAALHQLGPGDQLWLRGPFGTGYALRAGPALLVAGGYGSAPLSFLARRAREAGQEVHVALGARTEAALLLAGRFAELGCVVHRTTEDGTAGQPGLVTETAADLLGYLTFGAIYGCGPNAMLDALAALARERGLPCQLSYEAYMRCGLGVCGSCACGGQLVCRDGPVFSV